MSHEKYLIIINIPPSLEESMVDCLLTLENAQNFTSFRVSAHDPFNQNFSVDEQVMGRQRKIRFELHVEKNTIGLVLTRLKEGFSGANLEYWIMPIIEQGKI
ncbi:DUF3240 family protein [Methylomonas sp. AM2-LC]|uniref:DUF3240 family protein n=1 Tax=Methylomonas sp. AM2-LC TaxID=3153301 RepID=UPI003267F42C